ncbi:MAG: ABC transporter permease [Treponema sp.]|nr:ABC transporter permease [Candidatus Treponema caballi]
MEKDNTKKLDDATRVKVMSPGMLVAKRFFRNRLAIVGLIIIFVMFVFAFIGGEIIPYSESQTFYTTDILKKDYAGCVEITDFDYIMHEDAAIPSDLISKFILAITKKQTEFQTRDNSTIVLDEIAPDTYLISRKDGNSLTELSLASKFFFASSSEDISFDFDFCKQALLAIGNASDSFTADNKSFTLVPETHNSAMIKDSNGNDFAYVSNLIINCILPDVFITPAYRVTASNAIYNGLDTFDFTDTDGNTETFIISHKNDQYTIQRYQETRVISMFEQPSKTHPVGTDSHGMDLLARLMYGGRISLLIGFVVVFIELLLGVIIGGISGYFGGWVDTILMRVVDIIYCIPGIPLYMILGSIMDYYQVTPQIRIFALCIVLGLLGWVGIARIVRGQILSFREQEFMTAAEATGLSVRRRIFKHLIPNVVPQLVVYASMDIGSVILAESTLSFIGLGVKFPAASWGNIINAVNDSYVMTNYPFVWMPAGLLILLTVLAFNFIGDGLRDAFDPKMKR